MNYIVGLKTKKIKHISHISKLDASKFKSRQTLKQNKNIHILIFSLDEETYMTYMFKKQIKL
jgi:hypothetical protein